MINLTLLGGGTGLLGDMKNGGYSSIVSNVTIPYSLYASNNFCRRLTRKVLTFDYTIDLYYEGKNNLEEDKHVVINASLYSKDQRQNRLNRFYGFIYPYMLYVEFNESTRLEQENVISQFFDLKNIHNENFDQNHVIEVYDENKRLIKNLILHDISESISLVMYPGSFNPFHIGHQKILNNAQKWNSLYSIALEISKINADKGENEVNYASLYNSKSFSITSCSLFLDKVKLLDRYSDIPQRKVFVVGSDTFNRITDSKYYTNTVDFNITKSARYIVYPRTNHNIKETDFIHEYMIDFIPENISSTELRKC